MAGSRAAACKQLAALLPERERVSGPDHPHTLDARAHLARFTGEAGDAAAARDQYAALLPDRERVPGPSTGTPWRPGMSSPTGRGRPGMRPGRADSSPRSHRWSSGSWALRIAKR
jgi:hypothetical protein